MTRVWRLAVSTGWALALALGFVAGTVAGPTQFADDMMIRLGDDEGVTRSEMVFNLIKMNGNGARVLADGLDDLIVAKYGESLGIVASPEEVEAEIASWSEERRRGLEEYFDSEILRGVIARQLVRQKVLDRISRDVIEANGIQVDEGELMAFFVNEYAPANTRQARVRFSLIQLGSRDFAGQVLKKYRDGESFETLARSYSIHTESAARDGDMLELYDLTTAPKPLFPLVQAAMNLDVGEVSEILEANGSWFIVRADMKLDKVEPRFADHKEELRKMLLQSRAAPHLRKKFRELVESHPWDLECSMFSRDEIENFRPLVRLSGEAREQL